MVMMVMMGWCIWAGRWDLAGGDVLFVDLYPELDGYDVTTDE